ncbi:hypothetical protein L3X38_038700 [Prunus dulcis]|uniref:Uncharacterized protein n=1 Tax=Prunus dulcis TaxID=3755 RepID=A0AAD4V7V7_PRUDU|nr:hypothetical protein L3X38_038700 [Prunus dulcis]
MAQAVQAAALTGNGKGEFIQDYTLKDITPLALGVADKKFMQLIPRNSIIPVDKKLELCTNIDGQILINLPIYESDSSIPANLNFLSECSIRDIPPAPKHVHKFDVFFEIDPDGILSVSAVDKSTGQNREIIINRDKPKKSEGMQRTKR